jgi:hypothetical protein
MAKPVPDKVIMACDTILLRFKLCQIRTGQSPNPQHQNINLLPVYLKFMKKKFRSRTTLRIQQMKNQI